MTKDDQNQKDQPRSFSPFYERAIPIAIFIIVVTITGMLILTLGIALGFIQAG